MEPFIAWMSFSESERRRAMDAIDTLRLKDARDELGLGAIRDGFADLLFPGTGTVQTRARYFLFVPWIYRDLEGKRKDPAEVPRLAKQAEIALIDALEAGGEAEGIIGIVARERLKRLPSNIYWLGLQAWRICRFQGSQDGFHRFLRRPVGPAGFLGDRDAEAEDGPLRGAWHAGLPPKPQGFPQEATFRLLRREAEYLQERIITAAPGTLLSCLVREESRWEPVDFPWLHPSLGVLPSDLREQLVQARCFSETMHGAAILYNLLLADMTGRADLKEEYGARIEKWAADLRADPHLPAGSWPDVGFWAMASRTGRTIGARTRAFVRDWVAHVIDVLDGEQADSAAARRLIERRELEVKGSRKARLHDVSARSLWNGSAGLTRFEYRWTNAQQVLLDIHEGLMGRSGDA